MPGFTVIAAFLQIRYEKRIRPPLVPKIEYQMDRLIFDNTLKLQIHYGEGSLFNDSKR